MTQFANAKDAISQAKAVSLILTSKLVVDSQIKRTKTRLFVRHVSMDVAKALIAVTGSFGSYDVTKETVSMKLYGQFFKPLTIQQFMKQ